jgi:WD40 repeat protein
VKARNVIFILLFGCIELSFSQELVVQLGHTSPVTYLEVSPDGKFILSGTREGVVKLWDFHLGRLIRTYVKKLKKEEEAIAFFKETANSLKIPVQQMLGYDEREWKNGQVTVLMFDDEHRGG